MNGLEPDCQDHDVAENRDEELEDEGFEFVGTMLAYMGIVFVVILAALAGLIGAAMSVLAAL